MINGLFYSVFEFGRSSDKTHYMVCWLLVQHYM